MKNKLPIIIPIVIIVVLLGVIAYQFAETQFNDSSSDTTNRVTPPAGAGTGVGGPPEGSAPNGRKVEPPQSR